jgi:hypothetical protein
MDERRLDAVPGSFPARRRLGVRRAVILLVLLDAVVLLAAATIWLAMRDDQERENAVNEGLRGSRPPQGQSFPDLSTIPGIRPAMPNPTALRGRPIVLVATCVECRSGDVIGGFLSRLQPDDLPGESQIVVLAWGGDVDAWKRQWQLDPDRLELHAVATPTATSDVQQAVGIARVQGAEESGAAFVYDTSGRWRSTYFLGQLDREDIAHDLIELRNE